MDYTHVFDLKESVVNQLFGSPMLFIFVTLVIVIAVCIKSKVGLNATLVIGVLWAVIASTLIGYPNLLLALIILVVFGYFAYILYKTINTR